LHGHPIDLRRFSAYVIIGQYEGTVRIAQRVFQHLLDQSPTAREVHGLAMAAIASKSNKIISRDAFLTSNRTVH
jgi:hypothetical protein